MAEQTKEEQTLRDLLAKINHPLLEVRSRSLRSLSLKLRGGLVSAQSLVHERQLLSHLLQWFNFPEWSCEQPVLGLIDSLAEHEVAASTFLEIGAVEFLSQLRLHCDVSLHSSIDGILERLLRVPHSSLASSSHGAANSEPYSSSLLSSAGVISEEIATDQTLVPNETERQGSTAHGDVQSLTSSVSVPTPQRDLSSSSPYLPSHAIPPASLSSATSTTSSSRGHPIPSLPPLSQDHTSQFIGPVTTATSVTSSYITSTRMTSSYITSCTSSGNRLAISQGLSESEAVQYPTHPLLSHLYVNLKGSGPGESKPQNLFSAADCFPHSITVDGEGGGGGGRGKGKRRFFPWLRLSVNDLHILKTTESHLQSTHSLQSMCQFLEDVLLRDFPAEVFLQRPAILQVLFSALERNESSGAQRTSLYPCLSQLTSQLAHRLCVLASPACGSADSYTIHDIHVHNHDGQGLVSAAALTNQNAASQRSHDLEQLTQDMLVLLQSSEVPLERYCSTLLAVSTKHLSEYLSREGVRERSSQQRIERGSGLRSITACLELVAAAVEVVEVAGRIREEGEEKEDGWGLEHLCTALSHSLALWRHISNQCPPDHTPNSAHLQLTCRVCVCLAQYLQRMLLHSDCNKPPPYLGPLLQDVVMNPVLMLSSPQVHGKLCKLMERVDSQSYQMFQKIEELYVSFQRMSDFLGVKSDLEATPTSLAARPEPPGLGLAAAALPGLWVFCNDEFVCKTVDTCLKILSEQAPQECWDGARSLLLKLLAHGSDPVQAAAYRHLKEVLFAPLHPPLPLPLGEEFLDELCCRASLSPSPDVSRSAVVVLCEIVSLLGVEGDSGWGWVKESLLQKLPFIEASMSNDDRLFAAVRDFLNSDSVPEAVRVQSHLRMMFSTSTELRRYAFGVLTEKLSSPPSHTPSRHPTHDLFVMGKSPQHFQDSLGRRTTLERSDLVKLLRIVRSPTMDSLLKRSALEQLAILLTDFSLHLSALEEGIVVEILTVFRDNLKLKTKQPPATEVEVVREEEQQQQHGERERGQRERAAESGGGEEEEEEGGEVDPRGLLKACVQCLQQLAQTSPELRGQLAQTSPELRGQLASDDTFFLNMFRASIACASDPEFLHASSILLACLLFSPTAHWSSEDHLTMRLPESLLTRLQFAFPVGSYKLKNPHETPCPLPPSPQISSGPPSSPHAHTLSLLYHCAMAGGVENLLKKSPILNSLIGSSGRDEAKKLAGGKAEKRIDKGRGTHQKEVVDIPQPLEGGIAALMALSAQYALRECCSRLQGARSHADVAWWLSHMTLVGECCRYRCEVKETGAGGGGGGGGGGNGREGVGGDIDWKTTFGRFLQVHPNTTPDKTLLSCLLRCLTKLLGVGGGWSLQQLCGAAFLPWLVEQVACEESACLQTLRSRLEAPPNSEEEADESERRLKRDLLTFYVTLSERLATVRHTQSLSHTATTDHATSSRTSPHLREEVSLLPLMQTLSLCLPHLTTPSRSSLPTLQMCLQCLLHLSALLCHSGVTGRALLDVSTRLVASLREVVSSFLRGRGAMLASFMGRGVVGGASLALSHLLRGVASSGLPQSWYAHSLTSDPDSSGCGFVWLHCLTNDRDPQVRYAGFSILASMCGERGVVEKLAAKWAPGDNFGLWGACMRVGIDSAEWSLVRQQALLVLVALSALCHKHNLWEQLLTCRNEEQTLSGSAALEVFLDYYPLAQLLESSTPSDPHVASSTCQLLHNLTLSFSHLLHSKLQPLKDLGELLLRILDHRDVCSTRTPSASAGHLLMYCSALDLLQVLVTTGSKVILDLLLADSAAHRLSQMLALSWGDGAEKDSRLQLCVAVLGLLACVWEKAPLNLSLVVPSALLSQWTSFTVLLRHSLLHPTSSPATPSLQSLSLSLLISLLSHSLNRPGAPSTTFDRSPLESTLSALLDSESNTDHTHHKLDIDLYSSEEGGSKQQVESESESRRSGDVGSSLVPSGSVLCNALLEVYEGSELQRTGQKGRGQGAELVSTALCHLLASSQTAKQTALKGGFLDSSVELVRALHSQLLCAEPPQQTHGTTSLRRKEPVQVGLIVKRVDLLRSMMYRSSEVKTAAQHCELVPLVGALWSWCTVSPRLCRAVLNMLTVFTARNSEGRAALAASSRGADCLLYRILSHASHSLTSHRSCTAAKMSSPLAEVLASSLSLLTNCALSQECRGVMKKTGILSSFKTITLRPSKASSSSSSSSSSQRGDTGSVREPLLWIRLLVNLSFSSDGQQMIIKLPGALDTLLDVHHSAEPASQSRCLLVLRNLSFYGPGKTILVENENFLAVLTRGLESRDLQTRTMAASAVWALTHNCAKVKKTLKSAEILEKMEQLQSSLHLQLAANRNTEEAIPSKDSDTSSADGIHQLYRTTLTNAVSSLR